MELAVIGLNHKTAPLSMREALAVPSDRIRGLLHALLETAGVVEAAFLSTCNRVELYCITTGDTNQALDEASAKLLEHAGCPSNTLVDHGYRLNGLIAIRHIIRVASSLDSMVVGEPQILGQVKKAVQLAREAGSIGPQLDRIFTTSFSAAKRVRTETSIGKMRVSVGSVAVDLARRIFSDLNECRVMVLGAGKMGETTARSLAQAGASRVYVVNRSPQRARILAEKHDWHSRDFSELEDLLSQVDVVIASTGSPEPVITTRLVKRIIKARKYRPLFLVDIAVPRDVASDVGSLDTIYLYNVDDLVSICDENMQLREREVAAAELIVNEAVKQLETWFSMLAVQPTIAAIRTKIGSIAQSELAKSFDKRLKHLNDEDKQSLQKMMESTTNKLLHATMVALKQSADGTGVSGLAASARVLYGLDDSPAVAPNGVSSDAEPVDSTKADS